MKKIPTLFRRDPDDLSRVTKEVLPACEWVLRGEGVPTRKYDGTCVMLDKDGDWWARREVKRGQAFPPVFQPEQEDPATGKTVGWVPMHYSDFRKFHAEALANDSDIAFKPGTYELVGPKINGNPEGVDGHALVAHADADELRGGAITSDGAIELVRQAGELGWEGIVWHHPDGRMAKLKVRDISTSSSAVTGGES